MSSNFPSTNDVFTEPSSPGSTALSSTGTGSRNHTQHHRDLGDAVEAMQTEATLLAHSHDGSTPRHGSKLAQANTHQFPDTDASTSALHHTLGLGANQAAAGNHNLGMIVLYPSNTPPTGWLICDGSAISRTTFAALFGIISTSFGAGDGSTTFNIPNLKGRIPVGRDTGQTEFNVLGETGGEKAHTLTSTEMPSHTHTQNAHTHAQDAHAHTQTGKYTASGAHTHQGVGGGAAEAPNPTTGAASGMGNTTNAVAGNQNTTATNQSTGSDGAHNNLQPYIVLNYIIRV